MNPELPLPARAEPLEEDGDDAHGQGGAIQACLHLETSLSRLPVLFREPRSLTSSAYTSPTLSVWTFVGVSPGRATPMNGS